MAISNHSSRPFGVYMIPGHPEKFIIHAPDGQKVCEFTMTLREHPQVIGGWLLNVESRPGDAGRVTARIDNQNLYWTDGEKK